MSASNRRGACPLVATVSGDQMQDPLEALIAGGVPIRTLLGHKLCSLDWLAARIDHNFRLCYYDEDGQVVTEAVSAVSLLTRGQDLGWRPLEDEPTELGWPELFEEAIYFQYSGVHWYSTAVSDTDGMLPLALPKSVIEADRRASEVRARKAQARLKREKQAEAKRAAAEAKALGQRSIERFAERLQLEAAEAGKPVSAATARRRARAWMRQWTQDIATVMKRFTDSQEGGNDGR